jgi:hypothetical protein
MGLALAPSRSLRRKNSRLRIRVFEKAHPEHRSSTNESVGEKTEFLLLIQHHF